MAISKPNAHWEPGTSEEMVCQRITLRKSYGRKAAKALIEHLEQNEYINLSADKIKVLLSRKLVVKKQTHPTHLTAKVIGCLGSLSKVLFSAHPEMVDCGSDTATAARLKPQA